MEGSDGGAFVEGNFGVTDDADDELIPEGTGLAQGVAVAVVHHVEATVHVNADRLVVLLQLQQFLPVPQRERVVDAQGRDPYDHPSDQPCRDQPRVLHVLREIPG